MGEMRQINKTNEMITLIGTSKCPTSFLKRIANLSDQNNHKIHYNLNS